MKKTVIIVLGVVSFLLLVGIGFMVFGLDDGNKEMKRDSNVSQTRGNVSSENSASVSSKSESKLVLMNVGVSALSDTVFDKNAYREFKDKGLKGFFQFGEKLPHGATNPTFEFASLKKDTKIISPVDGVVVNYKEQPESSDYEVFIMPTNGSSYDIGIDHIVNLKVSKGQEVKAGDILGNPSRMNDGRYRTEIQINQNVGGTTYHVCPTSLLDESVKSAISKEITDMEKKWEEVSKLEMYKIEEEVFAGCLSEKFEVER